MSLSVSDAQQVYNLLVQIDALLRNVEAKTTTLTRDLPKTQETLKTFNQLERVTLRYLAISRRMGLPDDVDNAITKLMQIISTIRMAQMSINMMMMSNPATIALGIAGAVMTMATAADIMVGY
jgi:hypothetical protein